MKKTLVLGISTAVIVSAITGCNHISKELGKHAALYGPRGELIDEQIKEINNIGHIIKEYSNNFIDKEKNHE